jgi:cobalt/nickel transport system permease protein
MTGRMAAFYLPVDSPVHRLPPQCKLLAAIAFVLAVVSTPRERLWAFAGYAVLLAGVAATARVPLGVVARRMLIEVPFVAFAVLLPFVSRGERVEVAGVALSVSGLWAAWNILAKASLGVVASILLAATTEPRDIIRGAQRLRLPHLPTEIATFMLRYGDLIIEEFGRMRTARAARAFEARDLRQIRVLARSIAALFLRSYERGERVYLAMISRGYTGRLPPVPDDVPASGGQWALAAALPAAAAAIAVGAWTLP